MFLKKIACGLLCAAMLLAAGCGGVGTQTGGDKAYLQLTDAAGMRCCRQTQFRLPKSLKEW